MRRVILLILFTTPFVSIGQVSNSIARTDSIGLNSFLKKFTEAVTSRDETAIREMSLNVVHCPICIDRHFVSEVPIDTFINQLNKNRFTRLETASQEQAPIYHAYENYRNENITAHELFFLTIKPSEFGYSHEGQRIAFRFVKLKGEFKFCGLESVP